MNTMIPNLKRVARTLGVAMLASLAGSAQAGWTGAMNGTGFGWAGVNVASGMGIYGFAQTDRIDLPSAAMAPAIGYQKSSQLPLGASPYTLARVKGEGGYVWRASTSSYNGDSTDNAEIDRRTVIQPTSCPSLEMETQLTPTSFDGKNGTISVTAKGSAGTALLLTGFEVDDVNAIPVDDPNTTDKNETMDWLRANAKLRFENFMIGPFEYGSSGKCELVIPFSLEIGDLEKFVVTSDGVAKSSPIQVACPAPQVLECGDEYDYPTATGTGGCGQLTFAYDPPVSELQLGLNRVRLTATDQQGDTGSCEFDVTIVDSKPPQIQGCPENIVIRSSTGDPTQCSQVATWTEPSASDECGVASFTSTHASGSVFPLGVTTVQFTAKDETGHTTTCSFTVTVVDDTPPVPPTLPVLSASCGSVPAVTLPKALDNCSGLVTGVLTTLPPPGIPGTSLIRWTFTDASGNKSTADQTVIVATYTFLGFYGPIDAVGGTCTSVAKQINMGSTLPVKFDFKCGSNFVTSGPAPQVKIQRWSAECGILSEPVSVNAQYLNNWHVNVATTGWAKGLYKIIVVLPDNSEHHVFIKLK